MKDYLISHIKDVDGVTPVILMKLCHVDFEYHLLDVYEVEEFMNSFLESDLTKYNHIYITDLTVPESIYKKIEMHPCKEKFFIFDHHKTHLYADDYPYVTLDINECGTTLFYQYLKSKYSLETLALNQYIKSVKNLDLWLFESEKDTFAPILGLLFDLYGEERYIKEMAERLYNNQDEFNLTTFEKKLLKLEEETKKRYIDHREAHARKIHFEKLNALLVFAEKYRSELGHELLKRHPEIDFVIIINMNGGISFRSRNVDVSEIASKFGGGGHKLASGIGVDEKAVITFLNEQFKGKITYED